MGHGRCEKGRQGGEVEKGEAEKGGGGGGGHGRRGEGGGMGEGGTVQYTTSEYWE